MQRFVLALYTVALCVSFVGCVSPLASLDEQAMSAEERARVRSEFMMPEKDAPKRTALRSDATLKAQQQDAIRDAKLAKSDIPADPPPGVDPKLYGEIRRLILAADPDVRPKLEATLAAIVASGSLEKRSLDKGANGDSSGGNGSDKAEASQQARVGVTPSRQTIKNPPTIPSPNRVAATTQTAAKPATDVATPKAAPTPQLKPQESEPAIKFADHSTPVLPAYRSPVHVVPASAEEPLNDTAGTSTDEDNAGKEGDDDDEAQRDWREHLQDAIKQLQSKLDDKNIEAAEKKRLSAQLHLLFLMQENRDMALKPVSGLSTEEQEFWQEQLFAIDVLLKPDSLPDSDHRARLSLHHLRKAVDHLADHGSLEVGGLAFCTDVQGFGRFTQHNRENSFKSDSPVLLYAEVDNFMSREVPTGFETRLQARYQIYDISGRRIAEHSFPVLNEVCTNRRRDFFMSFLMYMPKDAPTGEYRLKLIIEDKHAQKFGESDIKFRLNS